MKDYPELREWAEEEWREALGGRARRKGIRKRRIFIRLGLRSYCSRFKIFLSPAPILAREISIYVYIPNSV